MSREELKALYGELQGLLSQAPEEREQNSITDAEVWTFYNKTVQRLSEIMHTNLDRYLVTPQDSGMGYEFVTVLSYRSKLAGLLSTVHGTYFSNRPFPIAGKKPNTIISQSQHQTQTQTVQLHLEMQRLIDNNIRRLEPASKERKFLEKVKGSLSSIKDVAQFLKEIVGTAKEFGLSVEDLKNIFS